MERTVEQVFGKKKFDKFTPEGQEDLRDIWRVAKRVAKTLTPEEFAILRRAIAGAYTFEVVDALAAAKDV